MAETLVVQPLPGIGDCIWHLPHMKAIANQVNGKITLLTKPRSQAGTLLKAEPYLDEVIWLHRYPGHHTGMLGFWRLVGMLRRYRFRRVYILHHSATYAAAAFSAGIPERFGFGLGLSKQLLNRGTFLPADIGKHPIVRADAFVKLNGYESENLIPHLHLEAEAVKWAAEYLENLPQPIFSFGIGSSEAVKQWGEENFSSLGNLLNGKFGGTLLVLGGKSENVMAEYIVRYNPRARKLIDLDLQRVSALISMSQVFVGNDTGVLNIASAVKTPVVGILGNRLSKFLTDFDRGIHPVYPPGGADRMSSDGSGAASILPEQVLEKIVEVLE